MVDMRQITSHTWDYSADRTHISADYVNRNIKYEEYDRFIETYKPKNQYSILKTKFFYGNDHWSSLFYGFSQSILLKREYELENGFEYDIVVKSRPDVIFNPHRGPSWPTIEEEKLILNHTNILKKRIIIINYSLHMVVICLMNLVCLI